MYQSSRIPAAHSQLLSARISSAGTREASSESALVRSTSAAVSFSRLSLTSDHVTCHVSALDQYLYDFASPVSLDLPARNYRSDQVVSELESQIRTTEASARALFDQCAKRSGDSMAYAGTRSVVRDLDFMASTIAPGEKMNYWGMSVSKENTRLQHDQTCVSTVRHYHRSIHDISAAA